jgi:hypothetical protein
VFLWVVGKVVNCGGGLCRFAKDVYIQIGGFSRDC